MQKFWQKHILAETQKFWLKHAISSCSMRHLIKGCRKLVTVRLSLLEVNRKSERNSVFPIEYIFFSSENILAKMKYRILAKSSVLKQKINPLSTLTSTILRTDIILSVESSSGRECSSHLRINFYAKILAKTHFG